MVVIKHTSTNQNLLINLHLLIRNWAKLAILSHSEPLWCEKIGKVADRAKLAVPSHSEPLQWEKIGKVVNWVKLAILSH